MTYPTASNPVLQAIYRRRATRAFAPAAVTDAQVRELLGAAVHAPSAMHVEPWAFVIVQDRALLARISERAKDLVALPPGADHRPLIRSGPLADPAFNIFYNAGTLIVICAKGGGPFATADCWLAAENLMLAATSLGLATCPIGFALPALGDAAIRAELRIRDGVTAVAPIIVGTAAAEPPVQARREPEILAWKR